MFGVEAAGMEAAGMEAAAGGGGGGGGGGVRQLAAAVLQSRGRVALPAISVHCQSTTRPANIAAPPLNPQPHP